MNKNSFHLISLIIVTLLFFGCSDSSTTPELEETPKTIQEAVNAASPGDTVWVAPGIYSDLQEYTDFAGRTFQVFCVMKSGVVLCGETGNPEDVIIDPLGQGVGFWFYEASTSTGLTSVTVRNALWGALGFEASPRIDNCIFENNGDLEVVSISAGTGINFDRSSSVISDCIFRNNEAASGAGATFSTSSNVRIDRCRFIDNYSTVSGGGFSLGNNSHATLNDCSIIGNISGDYGGGIFSNGYSLVVVGGIISENSATTRGGGCAIYDGVNGVRFENVVFVENSAPEAADGRAWLYSGEVNIVCCETDPSGWIGDVNIDNSECEE